MINNILVYTLEGCNNCNYLTSKLTSLSIRYEKYVCEQESEVCDNLEEFTNCFTYPIIRARVSNQSYVYLAVKPSNVNRKEVRLSSFDVLEWHASLDSIIDRIQELLETK